MKKILLTGKSGQVGFELQRTLAPLGEVVALDRTGLDLANHEALRLTLRKIRPDVIVNAAAYTAVDQAESEPELAYAGNAVAPGVMAEEARALSALLVHYSTDYVFDGKKEGAYREDDATHPLSVYGRSKLEGEQAIEASGCRHLIFRTCWVYGRRGKNFLRTMQRLGRERQELSIVANQFGAPTWSRLIAEATALALVSTGGEPPTGTYHLSCAGQTSWHGFAQAILAAQGWPGRLLPIPASEYRAAAQRPTNSRLDNGKLARDLGIALPDWRIALGLCLADE